MGPAYQMRGGKARGRFDKPLRDGRQKKRRGSGPAGQRARLPRDPPGRSLAPERGAGLARNGLTSHWSLHPKGPGREKRGKCKGAHDPQKNRGPEGPLMACTPLSCFKTLANPCGVLDLARHGSGPGVIQGLPHPSGDTGLPACPVHPCHASHLAYQARRRRFPDEPGDTSCARALVRRQG